MKTLTHPLTGDRVTILVSTEDSRGEVFRFEYDARTVTPAPEEHVHPDQEERLEVRSGVLRCRMAGLERVLHAGESLVIPPGTPHTVWQGDAEGSRSIGEYRPAGNAQVMLEAYFASR